MEFLTHSVLEINDAIYKINDSYGSKPMGTTLAVIIISDDWVVAAHCGDSRFYRLRNGELKLLTTDHSLVNEMILNGELTQEEAKSHPFAHVITRSIGPVAIDSFDPEECDRNPLCMPDAQAAERAGAYLRELMKEKNSSGGVVECVVQGLPAGLGDPVFEKLDANLAKAMLSIGAVKGFEIGDGFAASASCGSVNNDAFRMRGDAVVKATNHSGGVLGGISDGSDVVSLRESAWFPGRW